MGGSSRTVTIRTGAPFSSARPLAGYRLVTHEPNSRLHAQLETEIRRRIAAQAHDVYVLDEFTYPLKWGWVDVAEVVDVLARREGRQHVIVTGRDAASELIAAADLVMETTKIKHLWTRGRRGSAGSSGDQP